MRFWFLKEYPRREHGSAVRGGACCRVHFILDSWFEFDAQVNQSVHPSGVGEKLAGVSKKEACPSAGHR